MEAPLVVSIGRLEKKRFMPHNNSPVQLLVQHTQST